MGLLRTVKIILLFTLCTPLGGARAGHRGVEQLDISKLDTVVVAKSHLGKLSSDQMEDLFRFFATESLNVDASDNVRSFGGLYEIRFVQSTGHEAGEVDGSKTIYFYRRYLLSQVEKPTQVHSSESESSRLTLALIEELGRRDDLKSLAVLRSIALGQIGTLTKVEAHLWRVAQIRERAAKMIVKRYLANFEYSTGAILDELLVAMSSPDADVYVANFYDIFEALRHNHSRETLLLLVRIRTEVEKRLTNRSFIAPFLSENRLRLQLTKIHQMIREHSIRGTTPEASCASALR